jgi:chromosome segregation ATPase
MGAVCQTASTYLLPIKVIRHKKLDHELTELTEAEEFIRAWGTDLKVKIFTYGMELTTQRSIENLSNAYVQQLKDQLEEMDTFLSGAYDDFKEVADNCEKDVKTNTRGFHRKIEVIDKKVEEVQELINRYGNKSHQFELTKITSTAKDITRAYGRMRDAKGRPISNE